MNKNRRRRHQFYYERLKLELAFRRKAKALTIVTVQDEKQILHANPTFFRPNDPVYCPALCHGDIVHLTVTGHGYNQQLAIGDNRLYNNGAIEQGGVQAVWLATPFNKRLLEGLYRDKPFQTPMLCGVSLLQKLLEDDPLTPILCRVATNYASYITFVSKVLDNRDVMDSLGNTFHHAAPINLDGTLRYE